jgi:hypothetical protein
MALTAITTAQPIGERFNVLVGGINVLLAVAAAGTPNTLLTDAPPGQQFIIWADNTGSIACAVGGLPNVIVAPNVAQGQSFALDLGDQLITVQAGSSVARPIATRTWVPWSVGAAAGIPFMSRRLHTARQAMNNFTVSWANWGGITEANNGGNVDITAALEFPAGTFTRILFGGAVHGTILPGATLTCDPIALAIPAGSNFFTRFYQTGVVGVPFGQECKVAALGDADQSGGADLTMGGALVENQPTNSWFPVAITAPSSATRIFGFIGDSRVAGSILAGASDPSGNAGELASIQGIAGVPWVNAAVSGDTAQNFAAGNNARRLALVANCTHVFVQFGVNDFGTAAARYAALTTIRGFFPGKKAYILTVAPHTTGAWTLANGADQVDFGGLGPILNALNALIIANAAGYDGVFDVSPVARLGSNVLLWNADGTVSKYTQDGLHENLFTNNAYAWPAPA